MYPFAPHHSLRLAAAARATTLVVVCLLLSLSALSAGCADNKARREKTVLPSRYADLGPKEGVPAFMQNSIFERVELDGTDPYPVSNYGLVGRLRGTGDTFAPNAVRTAMYRELVKRGFGSPTLGYYKHISPDEVLRDPNYAIVRVDGYIPPGARRNDFIDLFVTALPRNKTSSLSHGVLFETDLKLEGAERSPSGSITVFVRGKGPVLVNPQYALDTRAVPDAAARRSLRTGVVMAESSMGGGRVLGDRPLRLVLRQPERRVARAIENRIDERFQDINVAAAQDEGVVELLVPTVKPYRGDWEHFAGVVTHLYLNGSTQFATKKSKELAELAVQPDAPLEDISYCWEALGAPALPYVMGLMAHPRPEVAFAAARAAAFIGDSTGAAHTTLIHMAAARNHPFQVSALRVLGKLPPSGSLNLMLQRLLDSDEKVVRIEAYKILAENKDRSVFSEVVKRAEGDERFVLDVVPSRGAPLIYASTRGKPRLAIIGKMPTLNPPVVFTALDNRLSISSNPRGRAMTIFYRDDRLPEPVKMLSNPDAAEVIARLGGRGAVAEDRFDFTYGEVLAVVKKMSDERRLSAMLDDGRVLPAAFIMQQPGRTEDEVFAAPSLEERPQSEPGQGLEGLELLDPSGRPVEPFERPQAPREFDETSESRPGVATPLRLPTDEEGRGDGGGGARGVR